MIAAVFIALDIWDFITPGYASAVFYELHEEPRSGEFTVRLLYKNDTAVNATSPPMPLVLPGRKLKQRISILK